MEPVTIGYLSQNEIHVLPVDVVSEQAKPNVYDLNLDFPCLAGSIRFWVPVNFRFVLEGEGEVRFVLNSRPGNGTRYPDLQYVVLQGDRVVEASRQQVQLIDFLDEAGVLLVPRLVEISDQGLVLRYYMEACHQLDSVRMEVVFPKLSTFIDGVLKLSPRRQVSTQKAEACI